MNTIFGKIIRGELPAERIWEDEELLVIRDKFPVAPVHFLLIPKEEITSLQAIKEEQLFYVEKIVKTAQLLAEEYGIAKGYRLLTNVGREGGQTIAHLHFHLIGGRALGILG